MPSLPMVDTTGPTPALELACLAIVALYVAARARRDPAPRAFFARLATLTAASWLAEDTCIRAYGFYHYHPAWSLFVDRVPILIVVIWPMVIHTAWDLARHLCDCGDAGGPRPGGLRIPLVAAAIVLADASLIEPIAVAAGLWQWTEPGLFAVPPIGILGWALFTFFALSVWTRRGTRRTDATSPTPATLASTVPIAAACVHLALLALWWCALRWLNGELSPWPFVAAAWALSLALTWRALRTRAGARVPLIELALRVPAAGFFFVLLALHPTGPALIAYALAFAPPYLALTWGALGRWRAAPN